MQGPLIGRNVRNKNKAGNSLKVSPDDDPALLYLFCDGRILSAGNTNGATTSQVRLQEVIFWTPLEDEVDEIWYFFLFETVLI